MRPVNASPQSDKSTSTRDGCKDSMNGSASSMENDSWATANEESEKSRRSPSRKRRLASIRKTESLAMGYTSAMIRVEDAFLKDFRKFTFLIVRLGFFLCEKLFSSCSSSYSYLGALCFRPFSLTVISNRSRGGPHVNGRFFGQIDHPCASWLLNMGNHLPPPAINACAFGTLQRVLWGRKG